MSTPVKLPLFPLQIVVYPEEDLNLHIFEPRYRQLIEDAEVLGQNFGIPTVIDGRMLPIGTEVELVEISKRYPSGESDIMTKGRRLFRLEDYQPKWGNKLYAGGEISWLDPDMEEDPIVNHEIVLLTREIYDRLGVDREVSDPDEGFVTYEIAHFIGMTREQEYELLTLMDGHDRQQFLLAHLKDIRPRIDERIDIRARALMNGHFKHLSPPDF
ncbi:MAG: LON peptidase substrate-binding domain-containing protein [Bacteroidota bacterium]